MKCKSSFIFIIILCLLISCSSNENESEGREEVIFNDNYKSDEIVISDNDFAGMNEITPVSKKSIEEITKVEDDNSKISILTDRYGNKTETRTFSSDPRLSLIVVRTSAEGQKQVFVYGQNGEVKSVPENMWSKLFTAPAEEIASAAGISPIRQEVFPAFEQNQSPQTEQQLQPLPSSKFPVITKQMPQISSKETEQQKIPENDLDPAKSDNNNLPNPESEN